MTIKLETFKEFSERVDKKLKIPPKKIGKWEFLEEKISLYNKSRGYEVDLEQIKNSNMYLRWVLHISDKCPRKEFDVGSFIYLLRDTFWYWFKTSPNLLLYDKSFVNWKDKKINNKKVNG